jgi:TRAP-type C4-dicarboxylate transport system permease small subunit
MAYLQKFLKFLLFVIVTVMLLVGLLQVFCRYVLQYSLSWSEELLRYLFIWSTFVGSPIAVIESKHASMDILSKKLKGRALKAYNIVLYSIELVIFVLLVRYGMRLSLNNTRQLSPAMRVSMQYVIGAIPFGGIFGIIATVYMIAKELLSLKTKGGK